MGAFTGGARARDLFDKGLGCNAIAKELGVSPSTISAWAKREGLEFDRAQVKAANQAREVDGKARRLELKLRAYKRAEALYDRLEAPTFKTLVRTEVGVEKARELDFVPAQNERDIAQAIQTHITAAMKMEAADGTPGLDDATSLLSRLGDALGVTSTHSA
ncbi:helix-turn-helix domain-containing protein [Leifsonia sp. AG29]|uniref:helix-turn-helix domain-containing protein n=1 Tax=Leifsonia sp. AG29 TaxID=2598860 RepID=UPI00131B98FD|nr:helix-turn-helix domain-containing protein [Leifsonia sp. AG29]